MTEIKYIIEYLSKLIVDYGLSYVPAEAFRQAKFDKDNPCQLLWNLLAELYIAKQSKWIIKPKDDNNELFKDKTKLVKFVQISLLADGYPAEKVEILSPERGSRALLLVFGWFMAKSQFVDHLMRLRIANTKTRWENKLCSGAAVSLEPSCKLNEEMLEKSDSNVPQLCDQLIWLFGKTKMSSRNLHDVYEAELRLMDRMWSMTDMDLSNFFHLSPKLAFQLSTQPAIQSQLRKLLKEETNVLNVFLQWKEQEGLFWKWMVTVINAHEAQAKPVEIARKSPEEDAEAPERADSPEKRPNGQFPLLRNITFLPYGRQTKSIEPISELTDKLAQLKNQLQADLDEKKRKASETLTELCSKLEGVICIPPLRFKPKPTKNWR